jgi:hypothetical protein
MIKINKAGVFVSAWIVLFMIFFSSCQTHQPGQTPKNSDSGINKSGPVIPSDTVPEYRKKQRKEAVAEYREKIEDPLNNWYFSVRVFETSKTYDYQLKLQFEEIKGEDTLRLPNFGSEPRPALVKGKDKYSCIIGFLDKRNNFKEYKLVSVREGRELKLTTLNHYAVTTYLDEK